MLKRLRLLIIILIAIIWFSIILPYFLVQTDVGANYTSHLLSTYSDNYTIRVGHISHSVSNPYELTLDNVTITDKTSSVTYLDVKRVIIGLKHNDLLQTNAFDYLLFEDGDMTISPSVPAITANVLQLKNISVQYPDPINQSTIALRNIYGAIEPWSPEVITKRADSRFNVTIQSANYNNLAIQAIFAQGYQQDHTLYLTNLGGDTGRGFFTANASINSDNSILINQLNLNKLHYQSQDQLSDINKLFANFPKADIQQLSIHDSSINLADISVENANLAIQNITYDNNWHLQNSTLSFNAQSLIWHDQLIEQPLLQWHKHGEKIVVEQAMGIWNKGRIKLSAYWQDNQLTITNIIAADIRYQLPVDWWQYLANSNLTNSLPAHIIVKQLTLMPSLIIDTNPAFPFQFTNFELFGNDLNIRSVAGALDIEGTVHFKADSGTLNAIELHKPDLSLSFTSPLSHASFGALLAQGVIEGEAEFSSFKQLQSLTINTHAINSEVFSRWYLINNPISSANMSVKLHGSLDPLSLNGVLNANGQTYPIQNNQLNGD